jgi:hypothetical protein
MFRMHNCPLEIAHRRVQALLAKSGSHHVTEHSVPVMSQLIA